MTPSTAVLLQTTSPDTPGNWPVIALVAAGVATGLSAGIFAAFQVAIVPALRNVSDDTYVSTFQAINRAILNPAFFSVFIGAPVLLAAATVGWWGEDRSVALWLGVACALQLANFGITIGGNVPLNDTLTQAGVVAGPAASAARMAFESSWSRLHLIRTVASVASTLAFGMAALTAIRN